MRERTKLGRVEKGIRQGAKAAGMTEQDFMSAVCDVYRSKQSGIEVWMKENGVEGVTPGSVLLEIVRGWDSSLSYPENLEAACRRAIPDTEKMTGNLEGLDLFLWNEDCVSLCPEEIESFSLKGLSLGTFLEKGVPRKKIVCSSAELTVRKAADRMYRTVFLTTDSVFESLSVENVESFGISWNDGGNVVYTKVRLPWYGFSVNSFEKFTRNPDGGATLIVMNRMENDSGNRSAM